MNEALCALLAQTTSVQRTAHATVCTSQHARHSNTSTQQKTLWPRNRVVLMPRPNYAN